MIKNERTLYLKTAGFDVKFVFEASDNVWSEDLLDRFKRRWQNSGFLKQQGKGDFIIKVSDHEQKIPVIEKNGNKIFSLNYIRDIEKETIEVFYYTSMATLQIVLKEALEYLLKDKGIILHASSVLDKRGNLFVFLAPQGGGKSTTANFLQKKGFSKFSDDNLILVKQRKRWIAYSPPFLEKDGIKKSRKANKLKFFFLRKSNKLLLSKFDSTSGELKALLGQVWLLKNNVDREKLLLVSDLVKKENIFILNLPKDDEKVGKIIYEA